MPRSPTSAKSTRRYANPKSRNKKKIDPEDHLLQDELDTDGSDDQPGESTNAQILKAVRHNLEQKSKKSVGHSALFSSRKLSLYNNARKSAKEIVNHSISAIEGIQAMLSEMRSQETGLQKYHEDCLLVMASNKDSFERLAALYPPICKELGQLRAEKLEGASTLLKSNAPRRHEILKEVSKRARQQLEQAKQQEKTAQDASKLIERCKNLIRA